MGLFDKISKASSAVTAFKNPKRTKFEEDVNFLKSLFYPHVSASEIRRAQDIFAKYSFHGSFFVANTGRGERADYEATAMQFYEYPSDFQRGGIPAKIPSKKDKDTPYWAKDSGNVGSYHSDDGGFMFELQRFVKFALKDNHSMENEMKQMLSALERR